MERSGSKVDSETDISHRSGKDETTKIFTAETAGEGSAGCEGRAAKGSPGEAPTARPGKKYVDEDSKSPEYRSDHFRMKSFKVVPCSKRYAHDWTICPFAHPGEKARRRDPRLFTYAGIACPDMKKAGFCSKGDNCPYAHNVFEYWLHPTRYRTQLCNDGTSCTRHVCFFAHTLEEMRAVPNKPASVEEGKREGPKDGNVSPDTPFLLPSSSLMTSSSTAGSEAWGVLGPENRTRSSNMLAEDCSVASRAHSTNGSGGSIDDVASNLKAAMSGEKRNEVINMLSKLLLEAVEDKNQDTDQRASSQAQRNYGSEFAQALKALDRSSAQTLLASTQRRYLTNRMHDPAGNLGPDWQRVIQDMLDISLGMPSTSAASSYMRRQSTNNALFTAPAALDATLAPLPASNLLSGNSGQLSEVDVPPRMLSADLGMPSFAPQNLWQPQGQSELPAIPCDLPRAPTNRITRHVSEAEVSAPPFGPTTLLEGGLFAGPEIPSANPNALRKQSFNFEDLNASSQQAPRLEVRRPPASAFQSAANQDWKNAPGRSISGDLSWTNSGPRVSTVSADLGSINESFLPFNDNNLAYSRIDNNGPLPYMGMSTSDRSQSTGIGGFETGFNLLPAPLNFPTTQPGGRDVSALHSAPYDLALAYASDLERAGQQGRHSLERPGLHGWGGLDYAQH